MVSGDGSDEFLKGFKSCLKGLKVPEDIQVEEVDRWAKDTDWETSASGRYLEG